MWHAERVLTYIVLACSMRELFTLFFSSKSLLLACCYRRWSCLWKFHCCCWTVKLVFVVYEVMLFKRVWTGFLGVQNVSWSTCLNLIQTQTHSLTTLDSKKVGTLCKTSIKNNATICKQTVYRQLFYIVFRSPCCNILYAIVCSTKWWTLLHNCLWRTESFKDSPFKFRIKIYYQKSLKMMIFSVMNPTFMMPSRYSIKFN